MLSINLNKKFWSIDVNQLKRYQQAFAEYANSVKRQMDSIIGSISPPQLETFRKFALEAQKYASLIPKVDLSILEGMRKTREIAIAAHESFKYFNEILFSLGWLPAGEWTVNHERYILKLYKENKIEQLDKEISQYYSTKRVKDIYNDWESSKKIKKVRLKILKDAIEAHIKRKYTISIILLLTQIEGEIRSYIEEYGRADYSKLLKKFKSKISKEKARGLFTTTMLVTIADTILKKLFLSHGI